MKITVTRPYLPAKSRIDKYLNRALDSRWVTNGGQLVKQLTEELEDFLGVSNLILVANGTLALQIAIKLTQMSGEVVTTPFSFPATSSALIWSGCSPSYYDIDMHTFNIDVDEKRLERQQPQGILATHVFGNPCDVHGLEALSSQNQLPCIFDAAHAFAVNYAGKSVLEYGDVSILSFHATKIFHCIEGGALIVRDPELFERARKMINFGFDDNGVLVDIGINAKMNEFEAAVGLAVLEDIDVILKGYKERSEIYDGLLSGELRRQQIAEGCNYNYSYFPVCFPSTDTLMAALDDLAERDIYPRRYFYPSLDTVSMYGGDGGCSNSIDVANTVACLPLYADLEKEKIEEICGVINCRL